MLATLCLPQPSRAQLVTVPPPAGISGEIIVTAPPGGSAVIYRVGLLGLFNKARLEQIDIRISPLATPLSAGLSQSDIAQLRLIESNNATFGDGDDVLLNTLPQGSIDVSGGVTSITDGGNASLLGIFPLPVGTLFKFYFIAADIPATARTGNAFRVAADANHIRTSVPSTIGAPITANNANRVVVSQLVPLFGVAPASLSFGNTLVFSSASLPLTITNTGAADLVITSVNDGQFVPDITSFTVPPSGSQVVNVAFMPTVTGPQSANLAITHNDTLPSIVTNVPMDGTGISPDIDVSPASLAFGDLLLGTSQVLPVTVRNLGTAPLNVSNITSSHGDYVPGITSFALAPGRTRVVDITFAPSTTGSLPATLSILHDDQLTGSPSAVALTGAGVNPVIGLAPATLAFGTVQVGSSADLALTVSNTGGTDLAISSITSDDGQFAPDLTSFTVSPGGNRIVTVTFTPTVGGEAGTLTLVHNAAGSPNTVAMSSAGADAGLTVSPLSLDFGDVAVGGTLALNLTVTNPGTSALHVTDVVSSDPQYAPDRTSVTVPPGADRIIVVTFAPAATGAQPATLSLTHDAAGSPTPVPMSGTGTSPDIHLSPATLSFGSVAVGSSLALPLTVTNTGAAPLNITGITSDDGQFSALPVSFSVPPGGNRAVTVTFAPAATGAQAGALSIVHNAVGSPTTAAVGGTGTSPGFALSPPALSFGNVVLGASSTLAVTVSNPGNRPLDVTNITSSAGQFVPDITFFTVPPLGNQVVNVTFTPTSTAPASAALTITHNATGSPGVLPVSGTGANPGIQVSHDSLAFQNVTFGNSADLAVTVYNIGGAPLTVSDISASNPQFAPDAASFVVGPGASHTLTVTFTPADLGDQSGLLFITHDALGGLVAVPMTGSGTVDVQLHSASFGTIAIGGSSTLAIPIANPGAASVTITSVVSSNPSFVPTESSLVIAPGGTDTIHVSFQPQGYGEHTGALAITHNPTILVPLSGFGFGQGNSERGGGGNGIKTLIVPFGGEVLMALALVLYALFRRS